MNDFGGFSFVREEVVPQDDRTWAIVAHLSNLAAPALGPLVVYLIKKEQSKFAAHAALQALFFSLAVIALIVIGWILAMLLMCVGIGVLLIPVILLLPLIHLFYSIVAAIHASNGRYYEYPVTRSFIPKSDAPLF